MRTAVVVASLAALISLASAADIVLSLPDTGPVERSTIRYVCAGLEPLEVEYINAGQNSLAVVPVAGEILVFVAVMSGSGARYASGSYVWWSKGPEATLYDERQGEDAAPVARCEEADD